MNRRTFLGNTILTAVAVSGFKLLNGCARPGEADSSEGKTASEIKFKLDEFSIDDLQKKMQGGELTARQITELYLQRIEAIDKGGHMLNSVIELNPDALSIADMLDQERKDGKIRGALHGIPVLIKDNIDTADKMMTTAGSLAMEGHIAKKDAFIVAELRKAGAIILGKTNLSEWANFRSTRSSSGWSSRGGQTRNPYMLDRSPCGSSSGSGSAVAANLCAIAIGTETNGSIICPSSTNGIVGLKPTVGLWSRSGIIPISATQDTAGPMGRTVRDVAILLGALTGQDPSDAAMRNERRAFSDYTTYLDPRALSGKIIGVEKSLMKGHEAIDLLLRNALDVMKSKGAMVVEIELMKELKDPESDEFNLLKFEFKDGLNRYLSNAGAKVKSLQDVITFNNANEEKTMPYFKQEILVASQEKPGLESDEYKKIYKRLIEKTRDAIDKIFKENKLNALCGPSNGPSWCIDLVNGDFFTGYGMYSPAAVAGYPSINVPMGMVLGLPVGLSFIARAYEEPELLRIAYAYEQVSKARVAPAFTSSVG
jgi:amidase